MDSLQRLSANPFDAAEQSKIEPTPEEYQRIMESLKDPEFRRMFEEYAKEISDPKNRAENLAYLQQLEAENQVPNGMKLVVPTPGFCLKSMAGQVKVFVNFCFSDEIDNASAEKADGGSSWQVPFIMPPQCRYDLDRDQQRVTVFDVVFGPQTIARAELQDSFKRMVIEVGLDGVDKNGKLETKLSRDFKLMQNVKARAAPIPALSIRSDSTAASQSKSNKNSKSAVPASSTLNALASKNVAPVAPSAPPAPAKVPSTVTSNRTSSAKPAASTTSPKVEKSVEKTIENTLETPKHSIVHRGEFSLQNFTVDRTEGLGARRPRELLVHIELPLLSTIASVELDVSDRDVRVHAPGVYAPLKIALPYRVDDAAAGAKFDKTSRRLTITLPLAALTAEEIASFKASIAPLSAPVEADPVVPESKPEPVAAVAATLNAASVSAVNDTKSSSAKQVPASTTASDKPSTPHFSMRQTPTLVTLLFKVTGVEPKSIRLNVTSKTLDLAFTSSPPTKAHRLTCVLADTVIPSKCSHTLNTKNLVVTLTKATGAEWPQLEGSGNFDILSVEKASTPIASPVSAPLATPASPKITPLPPAQAPSVSASKDVAFIPATQVIPAASATSAITQPAPARSASTAPDTAPSSDAFQIDGVDVARTATKSVVAEAPVNIKELGSTAPLTRIISSHETLFELD